MHHNVYLAQVNNRFGDQAFLPYSVGVIQAHCQRQPEIAENFRFQEFIFLRENVDHVARRFRDPRVLGISCYIWNWEYSRALARAVRSAHPDCLIVMGGPQVPLDSKEFFKLNPFVDILVHHEGEFAFADILRESLLPDPDYSKISGLSVRTQNSECIRTSAREAVKDVNQLASPYLAGTFDALIDLPYRWNASHETNRGCPYSCTFCDWGSAVFTKLRHFDDDRLMKELDWFGRHRIEILYNCDANFGIVPRDIGLSKKLAEVRTDYGYPVQFRPSFAKKSGPAVFEIAKVLQEVGLQRGITLSMQSMSDDCLTVIKRRNIKQDNLTELLNLYRSHGMPTYTELILGLPGETLESFRQGVSRLFGAGQHEGLLIYLCELLPNSEMATLHYRTLHSIRTTRLPMLLGYATPSADDIQEYFDVVIETATLPFEDWQKCFMLAWAVQCFHCLNISQALAMFFWTEFGLEYHAFYEELMEFAAANPELMLGQHYADTVAVMLEGTNGIGMGRPVPGFGELVWYPEEASFLSMITRKDQLFSELSSFIRQLASHHDLPMPTPLLEDLISYQKESLVDPLSLAESHLHLRYNLSHYFEEIYYGRTPKLSASDCDVTLQAIDEYRGDLSKYAIQAVRYGRKNNHLRRSAIRIEQTAADAM
ncbi:radical SAM protein [Streptomyces sp. NPDC005492]|uniref:B12-binding domain-containing radical SAM protein n=1 Tax=Streptomyces sp. NPDC005492 TaxID=3156883 RepID=UPI0033A4505D